jgi:chromosomal replication initiator protein
LVIEDLDRLPDAPTAQERVVTRLDAFLRQSIPVVVTLKQLFPSRWESGAETKSSARRLAPRLVSRLCAGLTVPLAPPGRDARLALVKEYALALGMVLPVAAAQRLAARHGTAPQLRGELIRLDARARENGVVLDERLVDMWLTPSTDAPVDLEMIAALAARYYDVSLADARSSSRRTAAVAARALAIYIARSRTNVSLHRIGAYFGGRDHTTILYNWRKMNRKVAANAELAGAVAEVERALSRR